MSPTIALLPNWYLLAWLTAMPRSRRIIAAGLPHHVTQRGNRRQRVFFREGDYRLYRRLLKEECLTAKLAVLAYCLMPNHVHLLLTPPTEASLAEAIGQAHRRYTAIVNRREGWTGFLWQGRFGSVPLFEDCDVLGAARCIECNPVEAGLVREPQYWPWSSARAHLTGAEDDLLTDALLRELAPDWRDLLGPGT